MRPALVLLLGCLAACHPGLSRAVIARHPPLTREQSSTELLSASASVAPAWVSGRLSEVQVLGQGSGGTLEEARRSAQVDLDRAAARKIGVDAASAFVAEESYVEVDGKSEERRDVHQESHARSAADLSLPASAEYWQELSAGGAPSFRVSLLGRLGPGRLAQARLLRARAKAEEEGRCFVLVLPRAEDLPVELLDAVVHLLRGRPGLAVGDAELARQLDTSAAVFPRVAELARADGRITLRLLDGGPERLRNLEGSSAFDLAPAAARIIERELGGCGERRAGR